MPLSALLLILLFLAVVMFWAGFLAPAQPRQHRAQVGFFVALALAGMAGYFAWRESRALGELEALVGRLSAVEEVDYVPTAAEVATLTRLLAATPSIGRFATEAGYERALADQAAERRTDYWIVKRRLTAESAFALHRREVARRGWTIETDSFPWLLLSRKGDRMLIFASDDWPRPGFTILYAYTRPPDSAAGPQ